MICEIIDDADIPVQVAGGIRTEQHVDWWFEHGASRIVLGTAAIKDNQLLRHVCHLYPDKIVVSIDVRGGYVLIDGWQTRTSFDPITLGRSFYDLGVAAVVYTDIDRFENHPESSLAGTSEMGTELDLPIISSGTVQTLDDISLLSLLPNIHGVITGRALFSGAVDLKEAIALAREPGVDPSLAGEGVRPQQASPTPTGQTLPPDYTTMGQELLDLHRAHTEGAVSAEEYQTARQKILTRFDK
jgi:phosphoribosylformimino-5-aminoimidazole carboxamide ribotide isomerase